ncbi:COG4315 family predicted lipoprotein [Haloarchaeobius sp. DYHT-AS-18]|uniref:COG4315 family predicted lipoprotein n=1 Tax=Haloarchaeobius sp. DYHT-AS-18 TaxID=3446117 RepID=UPI003EC0F5FB
MTYTRRSVLLASATSLGLAGVSGVAGALAPQARPQLATGAATLQTGTVSGVGEPVLVDSDGMTLYMFEADTQGSGESACTGGCANAWPPLLVEDEASVMVASTVTASVATIERADGTTQVTAEGWPLYRFAGDEKPGDANGQGLNDAWWVLCRCGRPIRT